MCWADGAEVVAAEMVAEVTIGAVVVDGVPARPNAVSVSSASAMHVWIPGITTAEVEAQEVVQQLHVPLAHSVGHVPTPRVLEERDFIARLRVTPAVGRSLDMR